jgi:hypothetical protein
MQSLEAAEPPTASLRAVSTDKPPRLKIRATTSLVGGLVAMALILGMATAAPAMAATPPTATTGVASVVSGNSAVISATVNPNGLTTTYAFQYGPTTNYGLQTSTKSAGSGANTMVVKATLSGLISSTTYHFRVVATNSLGSTVGTDATFTTAKVPPTATTGQPSAVKDTSAVVNATVNPSGKATTYAFQYGPTTNYGLQTPTTAARAGTANTAVSGTLSGLVAGTAYHYRVVATSSDGTAVGADVTFLTTGHRVDLTGPLPVVSDTAAVAISANDAQLNGAINPTGTDTTWYFEFGLTADYGLQTAPQKMSGVGARPINVRLAGLQSGSTYHYRLVAYNSTRLDIGPDLTFNTKQAVRAHPGGLVVTSSSKRGPTRLNIAVSGRLELPATITPAASCNGTVEIEVRRGTDTIGLRRVSLRPDCSYSLHVLIPTTRLHGYTQLGVFGFFAGNAVLLPSDSPRTLHI